MTSVLPALFDTTDTGCGDAYLACRDHYTKQDTRERIERAWRAVGHLCPEEPEQFVREFRRDFHARAWELYLLATLQLSGLALRRAPSHGPDILIDLSSRRRCWIECVVPRAGSGDDAVVQRPSGQWCGALYPEDKLLLRYRSALHDKLGKVAGYVKAGIIEPRDRVVIALNQGAIKDSDLHDTEVPLMAKALFPIGEPVMIVVPYGRGKPRVEVPSRHEVKKKSGSRVSTTLFVTDEAASISAVLFARNALWNLDWNPAKSLSVIHNPRASAPLARRTLPTRCEMWVTPKGSLRHRGKCGSFGRYSRET